jgi:hypothetical protein
MSMFADREMPSCPVPDEVNPNHDGGGTLGPLFVIDPAKSREKTDYPVFCDACAKILGVKGTQMQWPPEG